MKTINFLMLILVLLGCGKDIPVSGPIGLPGIAGQIGITGQDGTSGKNGSSCSVRTNIDCSITIFCTDGSSATLEVKGKCKD